MEEKINIAAILKDKPNGIKLYSPIFGKCTFCCVRKDTNDICVKKDNGVKEFFDSKGLYYNTGEVMLFPSKSMRDWEKLSWKRGYVLKNTTYEERIIFDGFLNDDYTYFKGKHSLDCSNKFNITYHEECNCFTGNYRIESMDAAQTYINTIEEKLDGKLNLESLEIEKAQPEFKDGDILVAEEDNYYDRVIFIAAIKDDIISKALINVRYEDYEVNYNEYRFGRNRNLRLATDSEKQQLFNALTKEGKAWDTEKKQIVDLKEHQFKPFEKVLVRDSYDDMWRASFFSHIKEDDGRYVTTYFTWKFCIPYEGNKHLLGTTNNVED